MKNLWLYTLIGVLGTFLVLTFGYESGYRDAPYQAWGGMMGQGGIGMHAPMMGGFGFGGFGLLFWILVAVFLYTLFSGSDAKGSYETPMDILNKRFAKGDITREEYHVMKKEILAGGT